MRDIPKALRIWRDLLALDGLVITDSPSDEAFVPGMLVASAALEMGLSWPIDQVLGTQHKTVAVLEAAGLHLVSFNQQLHRSTVNL